MTNQNQNQNQITFDAEQINSIQNKLNDFSKRCDDLRRYL